MDTSSESDGSRRARDHNVAAISAHFRPLIGARIEGYETAELLQVDGSWSAWPDLPIRLLTDRSGILAISWSRFDDLWLASDESLPFPIEDATIRWARNSIEPINPILGTSIHDALLGRGSMSIEGRDIDIWTRLVIQVDTGWLEIFNALDENGYAFHSQKPDGEFVTCL